MQVRAVEITGSGVGNAPMLPGPLSQTPSNDPDRVRHRPLSGSCCA